MNANYLREDDYDEEDADDSERVLPVGWWIGAAMFVGAMCTVSFFIGVFIGRIST